MILLTPNQPILANRMNKNLWLSEYYMEFLVQWAGYGEDSIVGNHIRASCMSIAYMIFFVSIELSLIPKERKKLRRIFFKIFPGIFILLINDRFYPVEF